MRSATTATLRNCGAAISILEVMLVSMCVYNTKLCECIPHGTITYTCLHMCTCIRTYTSKRIEIAAPLLRRVAVVALLIVNQHEKFVFMLFGFLSLILRDENGT